MEGKSSVGTSGILRTEITTKETAVEAIPRGLTTTKVEFERVVVELHPAGSDRTVRIDSADARPEAGEAPGEESPFRKGTRPLRSLVGCAIEVVQKPSGMIERVDGLDAAKERLEKGLAADDPRRQGIERVLSPGSLRFMLSPLMIVPEQRLGVGEEQHFQDIRPLPDTVGLPGFLYFRGTYRLVEVKDGVARLEMKADTSLDPSGTLPPWPPAAAAGRNRLRLERGACKAWSRITVETGRLEEDEHVTDLDLFYVKPDGSGEIPMPTKVTQRTKRLE
jgi:hypothetical protein